MNWWNKLPVDAGDGILHYSISKQSLKDPLYLLHHWGKPLYTLLSSPFAQLGFKWYVLFNILVFAATCFVVFLILKRLKGGWFYYSLFPLLLIAVPDYSYCVLGGMTEPFFGLLLVLLIYFAIRNKWLVFAIIASFTPFARSEGMLVVIAAAGLMLWFRQWKYLPFLVTGFLIYALAGSLVLSNFWWYFTEDPYPSYSIYGSGPWNHYLIYWKTHFGLITLILLPVGLFGCRILSKKKEIPGFTLIFLFGVGIYLGIVVIHSYFWAYGLRGAAGLTRIATLGLPVLMLFIVIGCESVTRELGRIPHLIGGTILILLFINEFPKLAYPLQPNPFEDILIQAADYVEEHYQKEQIYYYHPLLAWRMNVGMKETHTRYEQLCFANSKEVLYKTKPGGILIRDPQFGPVEHGLKLDFMAEFPEKFRLIKTIPTKVPYSVYTGEPAEVKIYQIMP
jgi:hypothetical protein